MRNVAELKLNLSEDHSQEQIHFFAFELINSRFDEFALQCLVCSSQRTRARAHRVEQERTVKFVGNSNEQFCHAERIRTMFEFSDEILVECNQERSLLKQRLNHNSFDFICELMPKSAFTLLTVRTAREREKRGKGKKIEMTPRRA